MYHIYDNIYTCKNFELIDVNISEVIKLSDIPKIDNTLQNLWNLMYQKKRFYLLLKNENNKTPGSD